MCDFLLFLGKLVIVLVCGIVSYLSFGGYIPEIKVRGSASPLNSIMVHFFIPVGCCQCCEAMDSEGSGSGQFARLGSRVRICV